MKTSNRSKQVVALKNNLSNYAIFVSMPTCHITTVVCGVPWLRSVAESPHQWLLGFSNRMDSWVYSLLGYLRIIQNLASALTSKQYI